MIGWLGLAVITDVGSSLGNGETKQRCLPHRIHKSNRNAEHSIT